MTDKVNALTVVLDKDIKKDDIEAIMIAIKTLKGVIAVDPNIAHATSYIAYETARHAILDKIKTVFNKD